jgi:Prokaryotic RING finger family 1
MSAVCPYCRTEVDNSVRCPICTTPHHPECWEENGGCTVFGCSEAPPDEPKISLGDPPPVAPPPLPGAIGAQGYYTDGGSYPQIGKGSDLATSHGVLDFFRRNPRAWDCVLVATWGTAVGALVGSAVGFAAGLCMALLAGQSRAIFAYPMTCSLFGQSVAVVAGLLALFFSGGKFAAFLRTFSQSFARAVLPRLPADGRDA